MTPLVPPIVGAIVGVATWLAVSRLPARQELDVLAAGLFALAAIYVGSALADSRRGVVYLEASVAAAIFALALAGVWYAPSLLAAGYFFHGVWDLLHHPYRVGATAGKVFPPFCLTADWVVALFILSRF